MQEARLDLLPLREVLDELRRVATTGEQADERAALVALGPSALHVQRHTLHKLLAQGVRNVLRCGDQRTVLPEGLDDAHALKLAQPILILRHLCHFRCLLVIPV